MSDTFVTTGSTNGTGTAVAATSSLAASTAQQIIAAGGNAVDAAVAAAFTALVAQPERAGLGGDTAMLVTLGPGQTPLVLNGQGASPHTATSAYFRDHLGLPAVPANGLLAAAVPGTVGALITALEQWGTVPLRAALEPAIAAAKSGVLLTPATAALWETCADLFDSEWTSTAQACQLNTGNGDEPTRLVQPVLAELLEDLLRDCEVNDRSKTLRSFTKEWYHGRVAQKILRFCADHEILDESGFRHGGLLSEPDLATWRPTIEPAVALTTNHATYYTSGTWSLGHSLLETLAICQKLPMLTAGTETLGTADQLHHFVETLKLAIADRYVWAEPDPEPDTSVANENFLTEEYLVQRSQLITPSASAELRPGDVPGRDLRLPRPTAAISHTERARRARLLTYLPVPSNTNGTAITVTDRRGMTVAVECVDGTIQNSPIVPGLGFALSTATARSHLQSGVCQELRGGKRPLTPVAPVLVQHDQHATTAIASCGGTAKVSWLAATLLRLVGDQPVLEVLGECHKLPLVSVPHTPQLDSPKDAHPNSVLLEDGFAPDTLRQLRTWGHLITRLPVGSLGGLQAVHRNTTEVAAAHDGRVPSSGVQAR